MVALAAAGLLSAMPAVAAGGLNGQVFGGSAPIANSTVTLWGASAGAPNQLARAHTCADGTLYCGPEGDRSPVLRAIFPGMNGSILQTQVMCGDFERYVIR